LPGGLSLSVGYIYVATSIFALCIVLVCAMLVYCYAKQVTAPRILPPMQPMAAGSTKQLALPSPAVAPQRDSAAVRKELVDALNKADELKTELETLLAAETGSSISALK